MPTQAPAVVVAPPRERRVPLSELSPEQREAFVTPGGFGRLFLKIPFTPKQEEIANAFAPNRARVSAVCCNEAGKTTKIITAVVLWHCMMFPRRGENGGVTATSGSWAQIVNQLMPSLQSHSARFPKWEFGATVIKRDGVPNFMAYSTRQAGLAEGFHGSPETPLLMLFDECKSVADGIIRAGEDRCRPQRMGLLSSPGFSVGKFYNSHTLEAPYWTRFKVTVDDCPWIDREEMKRVITRAGGGDYDRGLNDPFIRSAYWAEFMPFVEDSLIALSDIEECLADPPGWKGRERHGFCDFAAGGDENVYALRVGNRVMIRDAWRDRNTMSAAGRFVANFQRDKEEFGLRAEEIEGDADGLGRPFVDRIREVGWNILDFHANSPAMDPQRFRNRSAEVWFNGCDQIKERRVQMPDDAELKGQLVDRQARYVSDGRRAIESKEDLFKRQARDDRPLRSPDRADAVLGALAPLPRTGSWNVAEREAPLRHRKEFAAEWGDSGAQDLSVPEDVLGGFDAGG